jgi:hypothetical protein
MLSPPADWRKVSLFPADSLDLLQCAWDSCVVAMDKTYLVELVRDVTPRWDQRDKHYHNRELKPKFWYEIGEKLNVNVIFWCVCACTMYLRVNLFGPGPRLKNLPGRDLTKIEKHWFKTFSVSSWFLKLMHPPSSSVRILQGKVTAFQQKFVTVIILRVHHVPFTSLTVSRLRTSTCVAVSMGTHVGLNVATRSCNVYPDKCWFAVLCRFWLQCSCTLSSTHSKIRIVGKSTEIWIEPNINVVYLRHYPLEAAHNAMLPRRFADLYVIRMLSVSVYKKCWGLHLAYEIQFSRL